MYKYDPFSDKFTKIIDDGPVYTYPYVYIDIIDDGPVYIADECIEKIADAVVRKMKGEDGV